MRKNFIKSVFLKKRMEPFSTKLISIRTLYRTDYSSHSAPTSVERFLEALVVVIFIISGIDEIVIVSISAA